MTKRKFVYPEGQKPKLDHGTFGGTKASHFLVDMLNERDDPVLSRKVVGSFNHYFSGISELMKLDSPVRQTMLRIWFQRARDHAVDLWTSAGIDPKIYSATKDHASSATLVSLYDNVLHHRFRQADEHGELLEKFRGSDLEHAEICQALRNLAKYEKGRRDFEKEGGETFEEDRVTFVNTLLGTELGNG